MSRSWEGTRQKQTHRLYQSGNFEKQEGWRKEDEKKNMKNGPGCCQVPNRAPWIAPAVWNWAVKLHRFKFYCTFLEWSQEWHQGGGATPVTGRETTRPYYCLKLPNWHQRVYLAPSFLWSLFLFYYQLPEHTLGLPVWFEVPSGRPNLPSCCLPLAIEPFLSTLLLPLLLSSMTFWSTFWFLFFTFLHVGQVIGIPRSLSKLSIDPSATRVI